MRNILTSFDEFEGNSTISARDIQDHQSNYLDLYNKWRRKEVAEKENINDDIVFEMELVRQVEVNIDYILILVAKYHASNCEDKEILVDINKAINSSIQLRSKKELIEGFIATVNTATNVDDDWNTFVAEQKEADLTNLIEEENLNKEETKRFIDNCFRDGELRTFGTAIGKILPPVPLFGAGANNRQAKQQTIVEKLSKFFEKYLGLV
jgi:type I restriction enzyme R subunit